MFFRRPRVALFALAILPPLAAPAAFAFDVPEGLILVVHRGVVEGGRTENSLPALEAAIARGYTHVEVDLRATADGHVVCLHDRSLERTTGVDRNIDEVTLAELRELVDEATVPTFATFCGRAKGRIGLMPDVKGCPAAQREAYVRGMRSAMGKNGLLESALFIGRPDIGAEFLGAGRLAWRQSPAEARESERAADSPGEKYFVFNHGADFDRAAVEGFHAMGLKVIVSINTGHYREGDPIARGLRHIREMIELGVDGLQIDSVYDYALFGADKPARAGFGPGARSMPDAHNCYPYQGMWSDRIERALSTGTPVAIEQDLIWYEDPDTGARRSIVSHGKPFTGREPGLREYFFRAIEPVVTRALREDDKSDWPLITLNIDFKDDNEEHLRAVRGMLEERADWICSAARTSDIARASRLAVRPVLVLVGGSRRQGRVFHDEVPEGGPVLAFGQANTKRLAWGEPEEILTEHADNWRRWWNNSWHAIEKGGAPEGGEWTAEDDARLRAFADRAHRLGYWIRFYTINGHEGSGAGWGGGYNTGSLEAAQIRWHAEIQAGVDFIATDMYEEFADLLPRK